MGNELGSKATQKAEVLGAHPRLLTTPPDGRTDTDKAVVSYNTPPMRILRSRLGIRPNVPTTPLLQAYYGRSLRLSSLRALIRKEFASISYIAVSVRTGIALIFVLEYCALWGLEHNLNSRIM